MAGVFPLLTKYRGLSHIRSLTVVTRPASIAFRNATMSCEEGALKGYGFSLIIAAMEINNASGLLSLFPLSELLLLNIDISFQPCFCQSDGKRWFFSLAKTD